MLDDIVSINGEATAICLPRGELTPYSLSLPHGTPFECWEEIGGLLLKIKSGAQWWAADWIIQGTAFYGDAIYNRSQAITGWEYETLQNYLWVARKFPLARRRPELTWSHHQEVASSKDLSEADQDDLLDQAIQNKWSSKDLRKKVRELAQGSRDHTTDLVKLTFSFHRDQADEIEEMLTSCQQRTHMPEREDCLLFMLRLSSGAENTMAP